MTLFLFNAINFTAAVVGLLALLGRRSDLRPRDYPSLVLLAHVALFAGASLLGRITVDMGPISYLALWANGVILHSVLMPILEARRR